MGSWAPESSHAMPLDWLWVAMLQMPKRPTLDLLYLLGTAAAVG